MIAMIDYDAGNMRSVEKALLAMEYEPVITRDPEVILSADHVILPGVGAFGDAMQKLREYHLVEVIREVARRQIPFLGICLGLQLLFESSEESPGEPGLGLLPGKILRIPSGPDRKVPHMGWNSLHLTRESALYQGLPEGMFTYFVHSYYLQAESEEIVTATTDYGVTIHASIQQGNLMGCQFHPEKSSDVGLKILRNFAAMK